MAALRVLTCLFLVLLGVVPGALPAAAAPSQDGCRSLLFPVATSAGGPLAYSVRGKYCAPAVPASGTLQVLLAGATEGGVAYWDFPGDAHGDPHALAAMREAYSYARYLQREGYASLTLDRIGTGLSSKPIETEVTIQSNAFVVHQVVQQVRAGALGASYATIVAAGRSLSGPILYVEQSTYRDIDGMIVQSFSRTQNPAFFTFPTTFWPAQLDARLHGDPLGYFTTRAGTRAAMFFNQSDADPAVISGEESLKDTITASEVATFPPSFSASDNVTVPVYSIMGASDSFFCTAPDCPEAQKEAGYYPNAPCFANHVVPVVGHDMDLQYHASTDVFPFMLAWVASFPCGHGAAAHTVPPRS